MQTKLGGIVPFTTHAISGSEVTLCRYCSAMQRCVPTSLPPFRAAALTRRRAQKLRQARRDPGAGASSETLRRFPNARTNVPCAPPPNPVEDRHTSRPIARYEWIEVEFGLEEINEGVHLCRVTPIRG